MVTIEISSRHIHLIEVTKGKITRWASSALAPGIVVDEIVADYRALGSALRELMSSTGIREKTVILGVSSLYSISRIIPVARQSVQPLTEQAVIDAAETEMPLSASEAYFAWHQVSASENNRQVFVVSVPKEIIDSRLRSLGAAGLRSYILDLKTLALARAVNQTDAIVLNIDSSSFDIVVLAGGLAEAMHTEIWQPDILSIEEQAEILTSALTRVTSFYNARHVDAPLGEFTPFIVTGHLSGNTDLNELLAAPLPYTLEEYSSPLEHPSNMTVSQFAVNIGLALKPLATARNTMTLNIGQRRVSEPVEPLSHMIPDVNLLPSAYRAWRPSAKMVYLSFAAIVVLGLLAPFYSVTATELDKTASARQRYTAVNLLLEKRKAELAKREPLQNSVEQYRELVSRGGRLVDDITAIREIAGELKARLESITYAETSITFNCEAADFSTFRQFVNALEESGRFSTPLVPPEGYPYIRAGLITLTPKR